MRQVIVQKFKDLFLRAIKAFCGLLFTLATEPTIAAIPGHLMSNQPNLPLFTVSSPNLACSELNLSYIASLSEMARQDIRVRIEDYVPLNMSATGSEASVAREIIGRTFEKWAASNDFAQKTVGQALENIEKPLNSEVTHKDAAGVEHSLQFKVNASRAIASVSYAGYVNASLDYHVADQSLGLQISRPKSPNQKWIFNHTREGGDSRELVGYQIQF